MSDNTDKNADNVIDINFKEDGLQGEHENFPSFVLNIGNWAEEKDIIGIQSAVTEMTRALFTVHPNFTLAGQGTSVQDLLTRLQLQQGSHEIIDAGNLARVAQDGLVMNGDPNISHMVYGRRLLHDRAISVVGITHAMSGIDIYEMLNSWITAPLQRWDALICTSKAVRKLVLNVWEEYREYLKSRGIVAPNPPINLPVIPLGVDSGRFLYTKHSEEVRRKVRGMLGIGEYDTVFITVGRNDPITKMNPVPMFLAFAEAMRRMENPYHEVHLLMAGQFRQKTEEAYNRVIEPLCSGLNVKTVGAWPNVEELMFAADALLSPSDNIQESFGLNVVEAMAAGMEIIASDWNGYKDHWEALRWEHDPAPKSPADCSPPPLEGVSPLKTWMAHSSTEIGAMNANLYATGNLNYPRYTGEISQTVCVSVEDMVEQIVFFISSRRAELREGIEERRIEHRGELGKRAIGYDWEAVAFEYMDLFDELHEKRKTEACIGPMKGTNPDGLPNRVYAAYPVSPDPLRIFHHYPNAHISDRTVIFTHEASKSTLDKVKDLDMARVCADMLPPGEALDVILDGVKKFNGKEIRLRPDVEELVNRIHEETKLFKINIRVALIWMVKYDILRVQ